MSRLFYKFPISSNPCKYAEMELVNDEDVGRLSQFITRLGTDPDLDEISNDIDDEGTNKGKDVHPLSVRNLSCGIAIRNDLGAHMLSVDLDVALASNFREYLDIISSYWLVYSMKLSVDYKVAKSTPTLYVGWMSEEGPSSSIGCRQGKRDGLNIWPLSTCTDIEICHTMNFKGG
ncbi:hypothetical protein GOBAR_DD34315 [Gossypium barbadense]|nr:hypothetical protein GOBAR_DD34315 [Gossypium barbadense]